MESVESCKIVLEIKDMIFVKVRSVFKCICVFILTTKTIDCICISMKETLKVCKYCKYLLIATLRFYSYVCLYREIRLFIGS